MFGGDEEENVDGNGDEDGNGAYRGKDTENGEFTPKDICSLRMKHFNITDMFDKQWHVKLVHKVRSSLFIQMYNVKRLEIPMHVMSGIVELFIDKTIAKMHKKIDNIILTPNDTTMGIFKDYANEILQGINQDNYEKINIYVKRYRDNNYVDDEMDKKYKEVFDLCFSKLFAITTVHT